VILVGATNRPERVEPALLRSGRFDYIVRFSQPDAADRAAILRLCCRRVPLAPDIDIEALAGRAEAFTGADVETLCKKATLLAIARFQGGMGGSFVVRQRDFDAVLDNAERAGGAGKAGEAGKSGSRPDPPALPAPPAQPGF